MVRNNLTINIPPQLEIIIVKKKTNFLNIFIYNNTYILKLIINIENEFWDFDKETNSLNISRNLFNKNNIANTKTLEKFLKSWDIYFFYKIKFKGKGYRIRFYKKSKIMRFYFGRSHITVYKFKKIKIKKSGKYKFILKSLNPFNLKNTALNVIKVKPINRYTLRGLRISRQLVFKRKGKKGSYI